jgi:hypothetical protein
MSSRRARLNQVVPGECESSVNVRQDLLGQLGSFPRPIQKLHGGRVNP